MRRNLEVADSHRQLFYELAVAYGANWGRADDVADAAMERFGREPENAKVARQIARWIREQVR